MSTSDTVPSTLNLEQLTKQAKALRKSSGVQLSEALFTIAKQNGFPSWPKLKAHVDSMDAPPDTVAKFVDAVKADDSTRVLRLLKQNPGLARHVNDPLFSFDSPALVIAAGRGNRRMAGILLKAGADINVRSRWKAGGFGAVESADDAMAAFLIKQGAMVDIHAAAKHGMVDRITSLLDRDPLLVNAPGGDGMTPLHFASTVEVCGILLDHGAEIDRLDVDHHSTPAQYSLKSPDKLRYLLSCGARPDMFMACVLGDIDLADRLLTDEPGCLRLRLNKPPYNEGHIYLYTFGQAVRPVTLAVEHASAEFQEFLWDHGDVADRLLLACAQGNRARATEAMADAPLSSDDAAFLSDAAWDNRYDAVATMIEVGFDIDARGIDGGTALERAAMRGWVDLVRLLIAKGASLDVTNDYGGTPLGACIWGSQNWPKGAGDHAACIEVLKAAGGQ